jgi:tetratricopeptide (TPR) repeat protein
MLEIKSRLKRGEVTLAIAGMGGVGKSQIVQRYAKQYQADYDIVWWFDTGEDLEAQYAKFTAALILTTQIDGEKRNYKAPEESTLDNNILLSHYLLRLNKFNFLLIFGNTSQLTQILPLIPEASATQRAHVLVTTKNPALWHNMIEVHPFTRHESVEYIQTRLPYLSISEANELAEALYDTPLALSQATTYLQLRSGMSIKQYIDLSKNDRKNLWEAEQAVRNATHAVRLHSKRNTLQSTMQQSIQSIRVQSNEAFQLLALSALMDNPHPITEDVFTAFLKRLDVQSVDTVLGEALALLTGQALLQNSNEGASGISAYTMHATVRTVIQELLTHEEKRKVLHMAAAGLYEMIPSSLDQSLPMLWEHPSLLQHTNTLLEYANKIGLVDVHIHGLHLRLLEYYLLGINDLAKAGDLVSLIEGLPPIKYGSLAVRMPIMKAAFVLQNEHDYYKSMRLLNEVEPLIIDKVEYQEEQLMLYNGLAQAYLYLGDIEKATLYARKGEAVITKAEGNIGNQGEFYQILMRLSLEKGELEKAAAYAVQEQKYRRQYGHSIKMTLAIIEVLVKQGQCREAYSQSALLRPVVEKAQHTFLGPLLMWQSYAALCLKNTAEAHTLLRQATALLNHDPSRNSATLYFIMGEIARTEGRFSDAQSSYKQAEAMYDVLYPSKQIDDMSLLYTRLALIAAEYHNDVESQRYLKLHRLHFGSKHRRTREIQAGLVKAERFVGILP